MTNTSRDFLFAEQNSRLDSSTKMYRRICTVMDCDYKTGKYSLPAAAEQKYVAHWRKKHKVLS